MLSNTAYHPDFDELVNFEAIPLSDDPDTQVAQTIHRMRRHVREDSDSEPIRSQARTIQMEGSGDPLSDSFYAVKDRVGFRQDAELSQPIRGFLDGDVVEVLIRPRDLATMRKPLEDCDGFASYLPALLRAQGIQCSFVTVAADHREPGRFSHVYAACKEPRTGKRVALDASHGPYPGWECTSSGQVTRIKEWSIDGPDWGDLIFWGVITFLAIKIVSAL